MFRCEQLKEMWTKELSFFNDKNSKVTKRELQECIKYNLSEIKEGHCIKTVTFEIGVTPSER